jgi:hypothetical protein
MANPARTPGKHGYLPPDPDRFVPTFEHYLRTFEQLKPPQAVQDHLLAQAAVLPPVFGDIDRESLVPDWPMYCNGPDAGNPPASPNGVGDCTIAAPAHFFAAQRVYAGYPLPVFDDSAIISAYSAVSGYDPSTGANDNGADPVTVLNYLKTTGLQDANGNPHRIAGFARFAQPSNYQLMASALEVFGTLYVAIDCRQAQQDQFANGEPWQYVKGSPDDGGHMICFQRRRASGVGIWEAITWGAVQRTTLNFIHRQVMEVYAVVSEDWVRACGTAISGFDLYQLLSDMSGVQ